MRFINYINEQEEYLIPKIKKEVDRRLNPRTNRMKNFKKVKIL